MNSDEIRKGLQCAKIKWMEQGFTTAERWGMEALAKLAERYLAVEARMPKKKEITFSGDEATNVEKARNKAIDDCTLAATKMMLSREEIEQVCEKRETIIYERSCEGGLYLLKAQAEKMKEAK